MLNRFKFWNKEELAPKERDSFEEAWDEKQRAIRAHSEAPGFREQLKREVDEVDRLLDAYHVQPLDPALLRPKQAYGLPSGHTKESFLTLYETLRGYTALLTPGLVESIIKTQRGVDTIHLAKFMEDIAELNEEVALAVARKMLTSEEAESMLAMVGNVDSRSLMDSLKRKAPLLRHG